MSKDTATPHHLRYEGVVLVMAVTLVLALAWTFVLPLLNGTMVDELKYVIYAVFAACVLSAAHWVENRLVSLRASSE
jgi:hypothetical protein